MIKWEFKLKMPVLLVYHMYFLFFWRALFVLTSYVGGSISSCLDTSLTLYMGKSDFLLFIIYYSCVFVIVLFNVVIASISISPDGILEPFNNFTSSSSVSTSWWVPLTGNVFFKLGITFFGTGIALGLSTSWTLLIQ